MPGFSALHDLSAALQAQVIAALAGAPELGFAPDTANIVLAPPSDGLDDAVRASLYLYHVQIDPHLRNQPRLTEPSDPALALKPPLPLHLRYLLVPLAEDEEVNQLILGRVLQHFHDQPTFRPAPGSALARTRGGAPERLRVRPDLAGFEALSALWSALSRPYRLSAGFLVDILTVDSAQGARPEPRVAGTYAAVQSREDAA